MVLYIVTAIRRSDISAYIPILSRRNPAGISGILTRLRAFFRFLIAKRLIDENLIYCLQVTTAIRKKVRFGFSLDEADNILGAVDCSSLVGKRDYAMLLLARHTGLRGIDVLRLQMQDIDWSNNEIRIVQHKTKRPLILPLENLSFRRSIATTMLAANVPLHTISEILGHSRVDSTKPYLAADLETLKHVMGSYF